MNNDVFITGIGLLTPLGIGKEDTWHYMVQGKSGINYITHFDTSNLPVKIAGELLPDFEYMARSFFKRKIHYSKTLRFSKIAVTATALALEDAGIDLNTMTKEDTKRIAICIGTGTGGLLFTEEQVLRYYKDAKTGDVLSIVKVTPNAAASNIAINFNISGPSLTITTACASGGHAIGVAYDLIKMNRVDMALVGGVDTPLSPVSILGFNSLGVLSRRNDQPEKASRPFDKHRDGFVLSEGGCIVTLESRRHLETRGGRAYCQIRGWASNSEAYTMAIPIETGYGMADVMNLALSNAHLQPSDIDYINAHGTSTKMNDICETRAIKIVFGDLAPHLSISATKSMLGHTIGASGAIEVAVSALSIYHNKITPTINLEEADPECDLNYIPNVFVTKNVRAALSNSFGFGGNNCCIALSH
jgi:3-oxoacyl-[acyl-carrier-protein] synthase II